MKILELNNWENGLESTHYERVTKDIQEKLMRKITEAKNQKETSPYLKDWVEIQMRMAGNNLVIRKEFCFAEIVSGIEEDLAKLIELGEKNSKGRGVAFSAYLYPYEFKGRKLLEDYRVGFVVKKPAEEKVMKPDLTEETGAKIFPEIEGKAEEIKRAINEEVEQIIQSMEMTDPIDEIVIPLKKLKARERSEDFYENEIDYDFREWGVWKLDGTRKIIKKVFELKEIFTPNDLKKYLGNENPSQEEWSKFIDRLNEHDEGKNFRIGTATEFSLMRWMRKNKIIPMEFRENI
jgi:hypothetical protein